MSPLTLLGQAELREGLRGVLQGDGVPTLDEQPHEAGHDFG